MPESLPTPYGMIFVEREAIDLVSPEWLQAFPDAGIPRAMVSSAPAELIHGLDVVLGAGDVAQALPAPDLFLRAARAMDLAPERCVVLAATPESARAAIGAGCQALQVIATAKAKEVAHGACGRTSSAIRKMTPDRLRSLFFSSTETLYADVAVDIPVHQSYTYRVPDSLRDEIRLGSVVGVPVRARRARGVVVHLGLHTQAPKRRLKPIERVLTPEYALSPDLLALGKWMSDYYLASPGETLATISFFGLSDEKARIERRVMLADEEIWEGEASLDAPRLTSRQMQVVRFFLDTLNQPITRSELSQREGCSLSVIEALLRKGVLCADEAMLERDDAYTLPGRREGPLVFNAEQAEAYGRIWEALEAGRFEPFALYGITGSGKTEVYLQAIGQALKAGREAIVLVPEISLTPQAVARFRSRFGEQVGVYHSRLSRGQKFDLWRRIDRGEVRILIGARSALFAPFPNLGLIVVDEEHEHSYKQDDPAPRYHARDVAIWRARFAGAPVVLGSATPSLETFYNARQGRYTLLELTERVGGAKLPDIRLVDMGSLVREGRETSLISPILQNAIRERLALGEQVILFLNRRGFANFLLCLSCKSTLRCDHCDVVMTWHKAIRRMVCHFCGFEKPRPLVCSECGAPDPAPMGVGTQRIEEEILSLFPAARLLRIDLDTTRGKHGFLQLWEKIERGEADILLGTQMIAKGLHLERVTLVGVISADHSLFLPDFRAAERTFAQLTQVAGRAGRMLQHGEVIVQTFVPHHYAIRRAVVHDVNGFYEQELHMREMLRFPPFERLLLVRFSGENADAVIRRAEEFGRALRDRAARGNRFRDLLVVGPTPAPISRIQDQFRWQILLRGKSPLQMRLLLAEAASQTKTRSGGRGVRIALNMDPLNLL